MLPQNAGYRRWELTLQPFSACDDWYISSREIPLAPEQGDLPCLTVVVTGAPANDFGAPYAFTPAITARDGSATAIPDAKPDAADYVPRGGYPSRFAAIDAAEAWLERNFADLAHRYINPGPGGALPR